MKMKVLASVYACSPYDGSERAVGWNWIKELDKYHEITAITSHVYKKDIEDYCAKNPNVLKNTTFVYVDVPGTSWHVGYRLERLYYILWQKRAYKIAAKLCEKEKYELVHHITYVTCILPTFMHKLDVPFLYGPVSGGENTPAIIGYPMSKKQYIVERIRTLSQLFFSMTPNYHRTMKNAALILTTTEETKAIVPAKYRDKVRLFQSIGVTEDIFFPEPATKNNTVPQFLAAGRMLYWKGFEMTIRSFVEALKNGTKAELTILGDTENNKDYIVHREHLRKMCGEYLDREIHFVNRVPYSEMKNFYDKFDVLLNCSLRDSGCFVVMEAMSRGLPVICVDAGGPKVNTTSDSAIKIEPAPMNMMIQKVTEAIEVLANDSAKRVEMGRKARTHAMKNFLISERTKQMNCYYEEVRE